MTVRSASLLEQRGFEPPVPFGPFVLWMGCFAGGSESARHAGRSAQNLIADVHAGEMAVSAGPGRISNGLL